MAASLLESATFWTVFVGAVTTLVGAVVGAWLSHRYSNPKQQLEFQWRKNTALLEAASGASALAVSHSGSALTEPRIIDFFIRNAGKKDITADSFHGGASIEVKLDSKIIEVKGVDNAPDTSAAPSWSISPSQDRLLIAPSLLVGRQEVSFSVIVDGPGDESKFRFIAPLSGVSPRNVPTTDPNRKGVRLPAAAVFVLAVSMMSTLIVFGNTMTDNAKQREQNDELQRSGHTLGLCMVRAQQKHENTLPTSCFAAADSFGIWSLKR
ncbi:hypothetical protein GCM10010503_02980 [Streptomyces lucensis JCM 4490]|uniref:Uncharacterized protein n=2 Tax=Streptomyces lucensis TaxID=67319 RepID=A0A918ITD2_9ACTN|nr:hypothetical protein GCM10010503_02980 [Streptomyces lucensis JCM 4490]